MNLDYLIGTTVINLKKEKGTITEVVCQGKDIHLSVHFDSGRSAGFSFCNNGNYVTKYLNFTDGVVLDRLAADIEEDKKMKEEEKAKQAQTVTPVSTSTGNAPGNIIRFGKGKEKYGEFSNFNGPLVYDGRHYKCSEAAWQSMKTYDTSIRDEFSNLSGTAAKKKGRGLNLRADWERVKYDLMVEICYEKFKQNKAYRELLLSTGDATLVEDTTGWHDNYWGCCSCNRCKDIPGQNHLGLALMEVRDRLNAEK